MGGEKFPSSSLPQTYCGSPPRGRGKVILHPMHCPHGRITPAWAGKSHFFVIRVVQPKDHPRVGGEKFAKMPSSMWFIGSPPRGRGKVPQTITAKSGSRDHPRVGGEKMLSGTAADDETGSPPRGRGKVALAFSDVAVARITPAWAGKRVWSDSGAVATEDHPRVGGEKFEDCLIVLAF